MKEKSFILVKQKEKTQYGYTTGSCAAAAAGAAAKMLATKKIVKYVLLQTPKGFPLFLEVEKIKIEENCVTCAVQKDAGADSDVTDGIYIYATVSAGQENKIVIDGGIGVGRVTLPGLDQKVGNAAINSVPRKMIENSVNKYLSSANVIITIPSGVELAQKTFNPKLGIVGGISVLGTSGIVEPMSEDSILETIRIELHIRKLQGLKIISIAPGNYGRDFMKNQYDFSIDMAVTCSNFIFDCVKMAVAEGLSKLLFVGHIGKLVKVAGGIKNTHSKYGDHRMEILENIASLFCDKNIFPELKCELNNCISCDDAITVLKKYSLDKKVLYKMTELIQSNMILWSEKKLQVEVVVFSCIHGILGETSNANSWILELRGEK